MKTIKLMPDYYCHPLWYVSADQVGDIDPNDLPLSSSLRTALTNWARTYDETLNMDAPQDSGFPSEVLEASFIVEGHRLAECLRQELGRDYTVIEHIDLL